jgi:hypothetical protein
VHLPRTDLVILSLNEICGYLLAGASFLALAGTLKAGAHIRVTLVLAALSERARRYVELWAFSFAAVCAGYMTGHLANFAWVSFRFREVSPGVIRVPLAYPQAVMALGADPHHRIGRRVVHRRTGAASRSALPRTPSRWVRKKRDVGAELSPC